jgi:site-specific recombinase XerD
VFLENFYNGNCFFINSLLDNYKLKVFSSYNELIFANKEVTAETLKNKFLGIDEKAITLVEVFKEHNKMVFSLIGKTYSFGTWKRYETSLKHTIEFMKWKYNISDMEVKNIKPEFISYYDLWFRTIRNCCNNTSVKYLKNFRKIIKLCIDNEWINKDPFINYKTKLQPVDKNFLSEEQLESIINKEFKSERLSFVRDVFIFSCFTGLAYVDIKNLKYDDISTNISGARFIKIKRTKTKVDASIPLLPIAENILTKYKDNPKCLNQNLVLPILSNQKMNEYLKEIADLCEIREELTFHCARHTFATTVTLNNGVPIETVSKMLGHSSIRMTQHYAKILDSKVSNDMNILKEKLLQKELKMKTS